MIGTENFDTFFSFLWAWILVSGILIEGAILYIIATLIGKIDGVGYWKSCLCIVIGFLGYALTAPLIGWFVRITKTPVGLSLPSALSLIMGASYLVISCRVFYESSWRQAVKTVVIFLAVLGLMIAVPAAAGFAAFFS